MQISRKFLKCLIAVSKRPDFLLVFRFVSVVGPGRRDGGGVGGVGVLEKLKECSEKSSRDVQND